MSIAQTLLQQEYENNEFNFAPVCKKCGVEVDERGATCDDCLHHEHKLAQVGAIDDLCVDGCADGLKELFSNLNESVAQSFIKRIKQHVHPTEPSPTPESLLWMMNSILSDFDNFEV